MNIKDELMLTAEQLNEQWKKSYEQSEQAILSHPEAYAKMSSLINKIRFRVIDIDEYFDLAFQIAGHLNQLGSEAVFFKYFHEKIDPNLCGSPRFFRSLCLELSEQIHSLNQWRKSRRCLRIISSNLRKNQNENKEWMF